jgi:hypothetical protein
MHIGECDGNDSYGLNERLAGTDFTAADNQVNKSYSSKDWKSICASYVSLDDLA